MNKVIKRLSAWQIITIVFVVILFSIFGYRSYAKNYCYDSAFKNQSHFKNGEMYVKMKYKNGDDAGTYVDFDQYIEFCMNSKFKV